MTENEKNAVFQKALERDAKERREYWCWMYKQVADKLKKVL